MLSEKRKKIKQFYRSKQKKTNDITKRNQKKKNLNEKQRNQLINAIDKQSKRKRARENAGENQTLLNQRHLDLYRAVVS